MNARQFIASLANSLAWPVVVLVIALVFRAQVRQLLPLLRRLRAGPFEAEFDRLLSAVGGALDAPGTAVASDVSVRVPRTLVDEFAAAAISPLAAVLDGHAAVEQALRDLIAKVDPDQAKQRGAARLTQVALDKQLITPETASAIEGMTVMRNLAAHGRANEVTPERARDYLALVDAVLYAIRQGTRAPGPKKA